MGAFDPFKDIPAALTVMLEGPLAIPLVYNLPSKPGLPGAAPLVPPAGTDAPPAPPEGYPNPGLTLVALGAVAALAVVAGGAFLVERYILR